MKYENKCLGNKMFLTDLRNKEHEHKEIRKLLKEYGYTVKTPVYGNSAKKALQQIKDAKQELYRDFTTEEYNRVVLLEKYLKHLIEEQPLMEAGPPPTVNPAGVANLSGTAAEIAAGAIDPRFRRTGPNQIYRITIPGNVAAGMNKKEITLKMSEAERKAFLKGVHEIEEKAARQALIKKLAKEVGDKSAWQITKIIMAKIAARHAVATGASIWTGPGTLAVNAGMLGWDVYEIYKLARLVIQVRKLNELRQLDKAVDAVDTAADVATAVSTGQKAVQATVATAAAATVVAPGLAIIPNVSPDQPTIQGRRDLLPEEVKAIREANRQIDELLKKGSKRQGEGIETNQDILELQKKWEKIDPPAEVIKELPTSEVQPIPSTQTLINNADITWSQFADPIQDIIEQNTKRREALEKIRKADRDALNRADDEADDAAQDAAQTDTTKQLTGPEETVVPENIIIDLTTDQYYEIDSKHDKQEAIQKVLERPHHETLPANVKIIEPDTNTKTDTTTKADSDSLASIITATREKLQYMAAQELEAQQNRDAIKQQDTDTSTDKTPNVSSTAEIHEILKKFKKFYRNL